MPRAGEVKSRRKADYYLFGLLPTRLDLPVWLGPVRGEFARVSARANLETSFPSVSWEALLSLSLLSLLLLLLSRLLLARFCLRLAR